jgi:hypothetical protein
MSDLFDMDEKKEKDKDDEYKASSKKHSEHEKDQKKEDSERAKEWSSVDAHGVKLSAREEELAKDLMLFFDMERAEESLKGLVETARELAAYEQSVKEDAAAVKEISIGDQKFSRDDSKEILSKALEQLRDEQDRAMFGKLDDKQDDKQDGKPDDKSDGKQDGKSDGKSDDKGDSKQDAKPDRSHKVNVDIAAVEQWMAHKEEEKQKAKVPEKYRKLLKVESRKRDDERER